MREGSPSLTPDGDCGGATRGTRGGTGGGTRGSTGGGIRGGEEGEIITDQTQEKYLDAHFEYIESFKFEVQDRNKQSNSEAQVIKRGEKLIDKKFMSTLQAFFGPKIHRDGHLCVPFEVDMVGTPEVWNEGLILGTLSCGITKKGKCMFLSTEKFLDILARRDSNPALPKTNSECTHVCEFWNFEGDKEDTYNFKPKLVERTQDNTEYSRTFEKFPGLSVRSSMPTLACGKSVATCLRRHYRQLSLSFYQNNHRVFSAQQANSLLIDTLTRYFCSYTDLLFLYTFSPAPLLFGATVERPGKSFARSFEVIVVLKLP